jgi:hypothetical protein
MRVQIHALADGYTARVVCLTLAKRSQVQTPELPREA